MGRKTVFPVFAAAGLTVLIGLNQQVGAAVSLPMDAPDGQAGTVDLRLDFLDLGQAVDDFAVVVIAIHADEHLGRDLAEAIDDALHAEIRRCAGPDGADG